jgi:hypothetical protein
MINSAKSGGIFGIEAHTHGNPHGSRGNKGNFASRFYRNTKGSGIRFSSVQLLGSVQ